MAKFFNKNAVLVVLHCPVAKKTERRIYTASSTNIALAASLGFLCIVLVCLVAGCYLWNRRMSSSI
ncbi:hypothetical protein MAR_032422, partial [Mya arenaria]